MRTSHFMAGRAMSPPMPINTEERREGVRYRPRLGTRAGCRPGVPGMGPDLAECLVNISHNGASLVLSRPLSVGDLVTIELKSLGRLGEIRRRALVVWCAGTTSGLHRVGVQFNEPLPEAILRDFSGLPEE